MAFFQFWDSEHARRMREEEEAERVRREQAVARAVERIMHEIRDDRATEECPCCQGSGRLGIVIGAKDDR